MDGKLICFLCFFCVINQSNNSRKGQGDQYSDEEEKKLEDQQIGNDKEVKYDKIQTDKIMGSVQIGIKIAMSYGISGAKCDLIMPDFLKVDTIVFPRNGSSNTPKHEYPEFIFKTYAPVIFHRFREIYRIKHNVYKESFLSPLRGMSNPGASGSIFYTTQDDKFIIKTVQKKESRLLKKLLTGYYWNLKQNPQTMLPKFFGHYSYHSDSILINDCLWVDPSIRKSMDITFVTMNNLLPSNIKIHEKYDLKGSTYNRTASAIERSKKKPTYKDLDFKKNHPNGFFLNPNTYEKLVEILKKDCKVLKSFEIMDYSLLMGVNYVDRDEKEGKNQSKVQSPDSVEKKTNLHNKKKKNDLPIGSLPGSFTRGEVKSSKSVDNIRQTKKQSVGQSQNAGKKAAPTVRGIRALSASGERLLLFIGIIDVLQCFNFKKKLEHMYKGTIQDSDTVSVHKPDFYASRFLNFLTKNVFKIGVLPTDQWFSTFENDSSGVRTVYPGSSHTGNETLSYDPQPEIIKKKLGHRRVGNDGVVTYKKIGTDQIMRSIQMGIEYEIKHLSSRSEEDIVMSDFITKKAIVFPPNGTDDTPRHEFPEFTFKSYAPLIFYRFRKLYKIKPVNYMQSFCKLPLRELSNPGASGSIFYITSDDKYIMKTVQQQESKFLKYLFPWYYLHFNENQRTLLPKFFGHYRYQCSSKYSWVKSITGRSKKNIRLLVMNNLIPSNIEIHEKYDLKGSTHNRKASEKERKKKKPTYKDLDFIEKYPRGIFLEFDAYKELLDTLKRDLRVLQIYKIMDYSLLMGVHRISPDQTKKKKPIVQVLSNTIDEDIDGLEREAQSYDDVKKYALSLGGIPATNGNGQRLILFVGIIDVLQDYRLKKKVEHKLKSIIYDGNTISVHKPDFYASRFLDFMTESVFKILLSPLNSVSTFEETRNCEMNYSDMQRQEWLQEELLPWETT